MKDYIRDKGKIRNCDHNIAQMNIFEFILFDIRNGFFKYSIMNIAEQYKEGFENLFLAIINTITMVLFPIGLVIRAIFGIKNAKIRVEQYKF